VPAGRPTLCKPDIVEELCQRIAGGESLRSVCRDEHMPHHSTVLLWLAKGDNPKFFDQYAKARFAQGIGDADRIREIAAELLSPNSGVDAATARVVIDAFKWTAERNAAKVYGARQKVDHSSTDGSMTPDRSGQATADALNSIASKL